MNHRPVLLSVLAGNLAVAACRHTGDEGPETAPVGPPVLSEAAIRAALDEPVSFRDHVQPLFRQNCLPCHDGKENPRLVNLTNRSSVFSPGPYGPRVVPGKPERSLVIQNLSLTHAPVKSMPPVGSRMTPEETKVLKKWIAEDAVWPEE
jgi:mono/diheme cytochrome c family protein